MPANSDFSTILAQCLPTQYTQSEGEVAESLWQLFEIFPFLRDASERRGAISTAWCGAQSHLANSHAAARRETATALEPASQRQQLIQRAAVGPQRGGGAGKTHRALLEHVDAVGQCEREFDALLGEENGRALRLQFADLGE